MNCMNFKNLSIYFLLLTISVGYAQKSKKQKIFSIAESTVYSDEFLRVFKKNRDIVADENKKSIEEYLELYVNYKLKLKQAYELKYDTIGSYKSELAKYRAQLITPYLSDSEVTLALVKEAYARTKKEINASHILIQLPAKATPADTLKAYQKILEARNKILKGDAFETVAKQYSQDPSVQKNGGSLGYFSTFSMVYPFENAAYTTKVGDVSLPFKTRFGYHIVKVNSVRDSEGELEVAHIMIKEDPKDSINGETKINEIYARVLAGDKFEFLAKRHSEDRSSAINGGKLQKFTRARMVKEFADVSFSLVKLDDISKPFQTPYGWHIVKLLKKHPILSFEEMQNELTQKIEKSPRAAISGESIVNKLKKEYTIVEDKDIKQLFLAQDSLAISKRLEATIFTINGKSSTLKALTSKVNKKSNQPLIKSYDTFLESEVIQYFKDNLEETNQDFAFTMKEYKDGLLLFNILQDKVWKRAEKDSIGLVSFFKNNKEKYKWSKRGDLILASCTEVEKANLVKKYLEEGKSIKEIKTLVNEGARVHVIFTTGTLEEGNQKLPKGFVFESIGVTDVISVADNDFVVVNILNIIPSSLKKIDETRGKVINDYQEYLEQNWIKELKQKYLVKVKKRTLKKLIKQYK